jgi:hypothetical protein
MGKSGKAGNTSSAECLPTINHRQSVFPAENSPGANWALRITAMEVSEMVLPLEVLPLVHILTVLVAGGIGFYLMHKFAQ